MRDRSSARVVADPALCAEEEGILEGGASSSAAKTMAWSEGKVCEGMTWSGCQETEQVTDLLPFRRVCPRAKMKNVFPNVLNVKGGTMHDGCPACVHNEKAFQPKDLKAAVARVIAMGLGTNHLRRVEDHPILQLSVLRLVADLQKQFVRVHRFTSSSSTQNVSSRQNTTILKVAKYFVKEC